MQVAQDVPVPCKTVPFISSTDVPVPCKNVPFIYQPFDHSELDEVSKDFYVAAMAVLDAAKIPFLVGGAYAFAQYSGIHRHTKDFDIFVRKEDAENTLQVLHRDLNCKVDRTFHWLFKAIRGVNFIDIIFSSGNNIAVVDDAWFDKAPRRVVLGVSALLIPAEEMIWSKGFIMERERFDGADIAHILRGFGDKMDWERLLQRYDRHWRVLFSHLVLFGYIYPHEKSAIPDRVMTKLTQQLLQEQHDQPSPPLPPSPSPPLPIRTSSLPLPLPPSSISPDPSFLTCNPPLSTPSPLRLCQGTLLSRQQYLKDVAEWQYEDARTHSRNGMVPLMSDSEVAHWTAAAFNHGNGSA